MSVRTYSAGVVTAYGSAKEGGYTGTYAEFCEALGNLAEVIEDLEGMTVNVTTLPEGSSATASYADGVLSLGIPKGDKGDKGDTGETGNGIVSITKTGTSGLVDTYTITYTDGNTEIFAVTNGEKGDKGDTGATGNGIESVELTSTSGAIKTYTITFTDGTTTTFEVTDGEVTDESLAEILEDYALTNGYYEEMTVGNAEQLISNVYVEDSEAYKCRTSGGSADIGNREYDEIVGGTVAWNQLLQKKANKSSTTVNGVTYSITDEKISMSGAVTEAVYAEITSYTNIAVKKNHVYILAYPNTTSVPTEQCFKLVVTGSGVSYAEPRDGLQAYCFKGTANGTFTVYVRAVYTDAFTATLYQPQLFDLTVMFGSTIADYIYSLEQTTAGAGVAWFRKYFPEPYYAYNSGELISVEGLSSHDMVGFNQYTNGTAKVLGGNQYQITGSYTALSLDGETITPDSNGLFTPSATGTLTVTGGGNDTCVHLTWSGSRNGDYEEYVKHSYALDDSLTLRGIPKLSDGKLTFDGDVYEADGTVTRKYGIVDLGTLNWEVNGNYFRTRMPVAPKINNAKITCICHKYTTITGNNVSPALSARTTSISISTYSSTAYPLIIIDDDYSTASALKTALSGVYLVYELATPTTETAEPFQSPQIADDYGTEEYISTTIVPVGHNTKYMANSVDKLNHLPTLADSDGDYVIRQSGTQMSLIPMTQVKELPDAPSADGTYTLKVTVANGEATYSWES